MTTYEWLGLIAVLIAGFWAITKELVQIKEALVGKVSYEDCSEKRDKCPCVREFNKRIMERNEKK